MMLRSLMGVKKGDPYYAYRVLGLHGNGSNGGTVFTDNSPNAKTLTGFGSAQTSTAQSMFNGSSMLLDGTTSYITTPDSADWAFGSGNLTLSAFIRPASTGGVICSQWSPGTATDNAFLFYLNVGKLRFSYGSGASNPGADSTTSISTGVWTHVECVVIGGVAKYFIGGVLDATTQTLVGAINNSTQALAIGAYQNGSPYGSFFNGNIAELLIYKGVALHTANFTPPAQPFSNY